MSGKTNIDSALPSSLTVSPIQSTVKSRLRESWRYPGISAPYDAHVMLRNSACAIRLGWSHARAATAERPPGAPRDRPPGPHPDPRGAVRHRAGARRRRGPGARHPRQPGELPPAPAGEVRPGRGGAGGGARQARPGLAGDGGAGLHREPQASSRTRPVAEPPSTSSAPPSSPACTGSSTAPSPWTGPRAAGSSRRPTTRSSSPTRRPHQLRQEIDDLVEAWTGPHPRPRRGASDLPRGADAAAGPGDRRRVSRPRR